VSAIYGFFYVAVKLTLLQLTQEELIVSRIIFTAIIVFLIEIVFFKTRFNNSKDLLKLTALAVLGVFCVQSLLVVGLQQTTAFHGSLLMATIPIQTVFISMMSRREAFSWVKVVGITLSFLGVSLLVAMRSPNLHLPESYLWGDALVFLNAFSFSLFIIGNKELVQKYPAFSVMAYQYSIIAVFIAFAGGVYYLWDTLGGTNTVGVEIQHLISVYSQPEAFWLMTYIVIFGSIFSYGLNNFALVHTSPSTVAIYVFIQPVLAAIFGYFILRESFSIPMGIAGCLTFLGVLIGNNVLGLLKIQSQRFIEKKVR
jgi:drug/metabolite transporter (DMT)-like permease